MASERRPSPDLAGRQANTDGDPDWLERQYNMRIRHPERNAVYAEYMHRSERLREEVACLLDIRYGDGPRAVLDIFLGDEGGPLFVFIHGGYWRALDKSVFSFVAAPFIAHGVSVALINYDLAPDVTLDKIVEQTRQAISWLMRDSTIYGVNPSGMVVAGHSAGAYLAVTALTTDWAARGLPAGSISAAISISGIYELEPLLGTSINADVRLDRRTARCLSLHDKPASPSGSLALFVGADESDEFRRQTLDFAHTWRAAGHMAQTEVLPGRNHFTIVGDLADRESRIYDVSHRLLQAGSAKTGVSP